MISMKEKRLLFPKDTWSRLSPDRVAEAVTDHGESKTTGRQPDDIEVALGGQKAGGKQEAIPRQEEADQQTGFDKHYREDAEIADRLNQRLEIAVDEALKIKHHGQQST